MRKRIIDVALFFIIASYQTLSIPSMSAGTAYGHTVKRRKTNPELQLPKNQVCEYATQEKIRRCIEEICPTLPTVLVHIVTEYLKTMEWQVGNTWKAHGAGSQQILFEETAQGTNIISIYKDELYKIKNKRFDTKKIRPLPVNFYTRTHLLISQSNFYFTVDNDHLHNNTNRFVSIYKSLRNHLCPTFIKKYTNFSKFSHSTTTLLGVIKNDAPIIFDCESEEEWEVPVHLSALNLGFSPNSELLAISGLSGIIELWSIPKKQNIGTIASQNQTSWQALAVRSDGVIATTTDTHVVMHTPDAPDYSSSPANNVYQLEFSKCGSFLTTYNYNENCIEVRNSVTGILIQCLKIQQKSDSLLFATGFAINPNGRRIITSYLNGSLTEWKLKPASSCDIIL